MNENANLVAELFFQKYERPNLKNYNKSVNLSGWVLEWGLTNESKKLLESNANAFLFGALFDNMITAERAWEAPFELMRRLNQKELDLVEISKLKPEALATIIRGKQPGSSLHRFPNRMAKRLIYASNRIIKKYQGDAGNIWKNGNAKNIVNLLLEFDGMGQKIANMLTRMLPMYYAVGVTGFDEIDIAVDRHVARVFLRSGLINHDPSKKEYTVSEVKAKIIRCAREIESDFPGALDEPAYLIGKIWCAPSDPYCEVDDDDDDGPCPLAKHCARKVSLSVTK